MMLSFSQANALLKRCKEFFQVDKDIPIREVRAAVSEKCSRLNILSDRFLDAERHRWPRIYVEGPATGILGRLLCVCVHMHRRLHLLVRDLFGSSTTVLGAESGGSESLADFIIEGKT